MTNVLFDIPINNDNILEVDEDLTVIIMRSTLPNGVTRGGIGQATVTIVDDDGEKFMRTLYQNHYHVYYPNILMSYVTKEIYIVCFLSIYTENQMWTGGDH